MRIIYLLVVCFIGFAACTNSAEQTNNDAKTPETETTTADNKTNDTPPSKSVSDTKDAIKQLELGDKLPMADMAMMDISGKKTAPKDAAMENGLLVTFSCNTCPYVLAWEERYVAAANHALGKKVGVYTVNSNEAKRKDDDSYDAMKTYADKKGYKFSYVVDENSAFANACGATKTPDVFLFNNKMELVYKGAIDDSPKDASTVEVPYLKNAVDNMIEGKPIDPGTTKSIGCSIKRVKA
ncbi:MAG: thioredoxin family protein [Chitinophagales bacterium]